MFGGYVCAPVAPLSSDSNNHNHKNLINSVSHHSIITINANMLHHIYYAIWLLLRLLTGFYELLRLLLLQLQAVYHKSYDRLNQPEKSQMHHEFAFLERCKLELSKIPRHLSIIVGPKEGELDAEQFARIALYALNMDIDCISFYDTRNSFEAAANESSQYKGVTFEELQPPKFVSTMNLQKNRYRWTVLPNESKEQSGILNGKLEANGVQASNGTNGVPSHHKKVTEKSIEVVMLNAKDGRPLIAEVCQELYHQRHTSDIQNLLKDRAQLMQRIDTELSHKLNKLPDPELSIIFNRHTCTFGLLPWQTRFTEFHTIESGRYFNVETFAHVLYKFSRCEQRWGK